MIELHFEKDIVTDIWIALSEGQVLCDEKQNIVRVKKKGEYKNADMSFRMENKIRCALDRIEDTIDYMNTIKLGDKTHKGIAFDFYNFINTEYVVIHSIEELANIFGTSYDDIKKVQDCFNYKIDSAIDIKDGDFFEYVRSLCAVHPLDTSMHPKIHGYENFDCCLRVNWDSYGWRDDRDLSIVFFPSQKGEDMQTIGIKVDDFVRYQNKWISLLGKIADDVKKFIACEKSRYNQLRIPDVNEFNDYVEYIDMLKNEYAKREGKNNLYLFDEYKLAFTVKLSDLNNENKLEKYQAAIKYMFSFLHLQLQSMSKYEYTGITDLPKNTHTALFYEMHSPVSKTSTFGNEETRLVYANNLKSSTKYDVVYARQILDGIKEMANKYVVFSNTESADETKLLLNMAEYFGALEDEESVLGKSIPKTDEFRFLKDDG